MNSSERLRVLYVDENRDSFEMLKVMLDMSHIDVDSAQTSGEALKRARSERFDLYVLDSGLPDGSGLNLCRMLRTVNPAVPVLFYSGRAHLEDIERGVAVGAAGYITKPNSDKLAETILKLVTNQRERGDAMQDSRASSAA